MKTFLLAFFASTFLVGCSGYSPIVNIALSVMAACVVIGLIISGSAVAFRKKPEALKGTFIVKKDIARKVCALMDEFETSKSGQAAICYDVWELIESNMPDEFGSLPKEASYTLELRGSRPWVVWTCPGTLPQHIPAEILPMFILPKLYALLEAHNKETGEDLFWRLESKSFNPNWQGWELSLLQRDQDEEVFLGAISGAFSLELQQKAITLFERNRK